MFSTRISHIFIILTIFLFGQAAARATGFHVARQEIDTNSVSLKYNGCSKDQISKISNAWDDAIKIAKSVGTINWEEASTIDFFGSPILNGQLTLNANI
jgi:hypothetical protein